jgi:hypothetical protein
MLRILGFLVGTASVAAATLWLRAAPSEGALGVAPAATLTPAPGGAVAAVPDLSATPDPEGIAALPAGEPPPEPVAGSTPAEAGPAQTWAGGRPPDTGPEDTGPDTPIDPPQATPAADPAPPSPEDDDASPAEPVGANLHLLWSPFRSAAAAEGFARRLSQVSGVDVRVAEAAPGRYQVGFNYRDDLQRNWYLGQIQARVGLDLGADEQLLQAIADENPAEPADPADPAAVAADAHPGAHR